MKATATHWTLTISEGRKERESMSLPIELSFEDVRRIVDMVRAARPTAFVNVSETDENGMLPVGGSFIASTCWIHEHGFECFYQAVPDELPRWRKDEVEHLRARLNDPAECYLVGDVLYWAQTGSPVSVNLMRDAYIQPWAGQVQAVAAYIDAVHAMRMVASK